MPGFGCSGGGQGEGSGGGVASHGNGVAVAFGVAVADGIEGVAEGSVVAEAGVGVGVPVEASLGGAGVPSAGGFVYAGPGSGGAERGRFFAWLRESGTGDGEAADVGVFDVRVAVGDGFAVGLKATVVGEASVAGSW